MVPARYDGASYAPVRSEELYDVDEDQDVAPVFVNESRGGKVAGAALLLMVITGLAGASPQTTWPALRKG